MSSSTIDRSRRSTRVVVRQRPPFALQRNRGASQRHPSAPQSRRNARERRRNVCQHDAFAWMRHSVPCSTIRLRCSSQRTFGAVLAPACSAVHLPYTSGRPRRCTICSCRSAVHLRRSTIRSSRSAIVRFAARSAHLVARSVRLATRMTSSGTVFASPRDDRHLVRRFRRPSRPRIS